MHHTEVSHECVTPLVPDYYTWSPLSRGLPIVSLNWLLLLGMWGKIMRERRLTKVHEMYVFLELGDCYRANKLVHIHEGCYEPRCDKK